MYLAFKQERQSVNTTRLRPVPQARLLGSVLQGALWERERIYDKKRNILTKDYVEGIARSIKGLKMGRGGHTMEEEPGTLYQAADWDRVNTSRMAGKIQS